MHTASALTGHVPALVSLPPCTHLLNTHAHPAHANMQAFEHWLQRAPKPRPARATWEADPDFRAAAERVERIYERSPDMRAIHEIEDHGSFVVVNGQICGKRPTNEPPNYIAVCPLNPEIFIVPEIGLVVHKPKPEYYPIIMNCGDRDEPLCEDAPGGCG